MRERPVCPLRSVPFGPFGPTTPAAGTLLSGRDRCYCFFVGMGIVRWRLPVFGSTVSFTSECSSARANTSPKGTLQIRNPEKSLKVGQALPLGVLASRFGPQEKYSVLPESHTNGVR